MPSSHFCDGKAITSGSSASAASRSAPTDCAPSTIVMIFAARARGRSVSSGRMRPLNQLTREMRSRRVGASKSCETCSISSSSVRSVLRSVRRLTVSILRPIRAASAARLPRIAGYSSSSVTMRSPGFHSMPRTARITASVVLCDTATKSRSVARTEAKTPRSSSIRVSTSSITCSEPRPVASSCS